jgi:DNA-binding IclR family transcriptional regulator
VRVVQTLQRGLAVLDYMAASVEPVRAVDVAERFALDKANASRLLMTLQDSGWVRRRDDRRYVLRPKFSADGGKSLESLLALRERTHSLLESLVEISSECAHMAVCVGEKVWYIDKVASPQVLRVDHPVGALAPLHCTALGKVFLAFGRQTLPSEMEQYTNRTLTSATAVEANLREARRNGFASDDEEFSPGVRCVAAAIRRTDGATVAAVGLSGPSVRVDARRLNELGRLLRDRCKTVVPSEENEE